jgi:hypothetical protein
MECVSKWIFCNYSAGNFRIFLGDKTVEN